MPRLPDPPHDEPLGLVLQWLDDGARDAGQRNPAAMALATADADGRPSVRLVLLKSVSTEGGYGVFYTNRQSRKGLELGVNPRAAGALYWERLGRQLRLEGPVAPSPDDESDAYYATRPHGSRINAWVSAQSRPIDAHAELRERAETKARELATATQIPRPPFWGGYRLWFEVVEFWMEGADRLHERLCYRRALTALDHGRGFAAGPWRSQLLQP